MKKLEGEHLVGEGTRGVGNKGGAGGNEGGGETQEILFQVWRQLTALSIT